MSALLSLGALYLFFFYFPKEIKRNSRLDLAVVFLLTMTSALTLFTDWVFKGVSFAPAGHKFPMVAGMTSVFSYIFISILIIIVIGVPIKNYYNFSIDDKRKMKYVFGGFAFYWMMNVIFNIFMAPRYVDFPYYYLAGYSSIVQIILTAYAIRTQHLFSGKVVTAELFTFLIWALSLGRIFMAVSTIDRIIDIVIFIITFIFGIFLIKSVMREVEQKDKLKELSAELKDLNLHLQEKVDEQTKEIRRAYDVEKKARIDLEELDKSKTQFILSTEHHLRTPLTISKGFLEAFITKYSQVLNDEGKSYIDRVREATNRTMNLVNELLEVSQMGVGKGILKLELVNIKDLISNVISGSKAEIDGKRLKIIFDFSEDDKNNFLNLDKEKITEAFTNLISNAIKYNKTGGEIKITGRIIIKEENNNSKKLYQVFIEDQGIGMSKENITKLFEHVFDRGEEAKRLYATGKGIGLAVVKSVVEAHGGTVRAESEGEGKGSRFIIELPI
jgi:signal transduction histidine kinase